ncbi:hypothetical protein AHiyo8_11200 [Arthrobacter sp. Hiyo8]|nr:hypothetical protein AHiyo8_11200 [Arthrobacter sp. Hiyo8]
MESPLLLGPEDEPVRDPEFMRTEDATLGELLRLWRSRKAFEEMLDVWSGVLDSGRPAEFDCEAAAFLRASLRVSAWRDAVVVLAAAGKTVACGGAEAFGFFDQDDDEQGSLVVPPGLCPLHQQRASGLRPRMSASCAMETCSWASTRRTPTGDG